MARSLWGFVALVGLACGDPADIDEQPVDGETDAVETETEPPPSGGGDTAAPPAPEEAAEFTPYGFFVESWLAYDPATDATTSFTLGDATRRTLIDVFVFSEDWDGTFGDIDHYCMVEIEADADLPRAQWVDGYAGLLFGVSKPREIGVQGSCDDRIRGVPGDADDLIAGLHWGISYAEPLSDDVREALLASGLTEDDLVQFIGGGLLGDAVDVIQNHGLLPFGYVSGYEVDDSFVVVTNSSGDARPLDAAQMVVGGSLQRGVYVCDTLALAWDYLASALANP
jgi:hypothetical protein